MRKPVAFVAFVAMLGLGAATDASAQGSVAWKTVVLGRYSARAYLDTLVRNRYVGADESLRLGSIENVQHMFSRIQFSSSPRTVRLAVLTVRQLGLPGGATLTTVYRTALASGFELCPPEVGPALRLQYDDGPLGLGKGAFDYLNIAMEPIADKEGTRRIFGITAVGQPPPPGDEEAEFYVAFDSFELIEPGSGDIPGLPKGYEDPRTRFVFVIP